MRKDIIISSFKKLPRGFLVVVLLFLLTEWFLYSNRPEIVKDYWNKFLINEHNLTDLPEDYDYLIMGDSVQKTGINPALVSDRVLNLGLPGAKPMGQFLMLKRYLEKHKPPKAVFLYVDPENPHDSLFVILRYFVSIPEFVSIWRDLSWEERRYFMLRYWVSLDERKVRLTRRPFYLKGNDTFIGEMIKNQGYMPVPNPGKAISDDYFAGHAERHQNKVWISKRDMKYLNEFFKLASSKGIKVVFLGFLIPKELHGLLEESGFNTNYLIFFEILNRLYPDAHFVENPIFYLENKYFSDMSHLNNDGSKIYTEYFKALFNRLKERGEI